MNTRDRLIGTLYDDRYRVEKRVGAGGMANVYLAVDETLGRQVAIKVLNERYAEDEQFVERFLREASAAARLNHPNIVQVYDRGEADHTYYIAMEYVNGMTLKELIGRRGSLTEDETCAYGRQALNALRFAHRNGIVHRDVKPHNFMIDTEGRLKIADFGIARAGADAGLTEVGSIVGTAQYLSPEQAQGQTVSAPSDLYALGVVLFEMITGRVPYAGDQPVNVALRHVNDPVPSARAIDPSVSEGLEAVIVRAMQKDPAARYQTADEMLHALDVVRQGGVPGGAAAGATIAGTTQVLSRSDLARTAITPPPPRPVPVDAGRAYAESTFVGGAHDADFVSEEPVARRKSWPWVLLLLVLAALALAAWLSMRGGGGDDPANDAVEVRVPEVVGLTESRARTAIERRGLEVGQVSREFDEDAPEGTVTEQDPGNGTTAQEGDSVDLTVSRGVEPIEVPSVVGLTKKQALTAFAERGLRRPTVVTEFSEDEPNTVLEQTPTAGDKVAPNAATTITVSKGEEAQTVPPVVGQSATEAQAELKSAGFASRVVEADGPAAAGEVLSQEPAANATAAPGSTVTLTVGSGSNTVPNVIEQSEAEATALLREAGFEVQSTQVEDPTLTPGDTPRVTDQSAAPESSLELGQTVTITVSNPPLAESRVVRGEGNRGGNGNDRDKRDRGDDEGDDDE